MGLYHGLRRPNVDREVYLAHAYVGGRGLTPTPYEWGGVLHLLHK
jgi:hypothetical protein